jgi:hypothetical protein
VWCVVSHIGCGDGAMSFVEGYAVCVCISWRMDSSELSSASTADVSTSIVESSGSKSMGLVCEPAASVPLKSAESTPSGVGFQTLCSCVRLQCGISVPLHYVSM